MEVISAAVRQASEARLRMGMVPRLGGLGVGVRVYDPSAVHVVRVVEKRRRRRVPDEEDTQPASQSPSYFFSAMHAQCVWMKYALPIKERLRRATADARRPRPRWSEHTLDVTELRTCRSGSAADAPLCEVFFGRKEMYRI